MEGRHHLDLNEPHHRLHVHLGHWLVATESLQSLIWEEEKLPHRKLLHLCQLMLVWIDIDLYTYSVLVDLHDQINIWGVCIVGRIRFMVSSLGGFVTFPFYVSLRIMRVKSITCRWWSYFVQVAPILATDRRESLLWTLILLCGLLCGGWTATRFSKMVHSKTICTLRVVRGTRFSKTWLTTAVTSASLWKLWSALSLLLV